MPDLGFALPRFVERALRLPTHMVGSVVFDLEVSGKDHIPRKGPAVIAANHFSHLDPPIIGTNLDRYIRFLAVDQLYGKSVLLDATLGFFGAIPLDRDGYPIRALRTAIDHLEKGNLVGLFPEGRRVEMWGVNPPKRGAAWLAWMTGAPLIPVTIHGSQDSLAPLQRSFARTAIRVWVDEPIWWHAYADEVDPLQSMMDAWYEVVNDHLEPWRPHG